MSKGFTRYKIHDQNELYFITFSTVEWVDVFSRKSYKDILIDSLKYCQHNKGLELFAWTIMNNHVHLVVRAKNGFRLSDILRDFKKYTSVKIIDEIKNKPESRKEWMLQLFRKAGSENPKNTVYQLWRNDNHPIFLRSPKVIQQKITYIHNNAVESGLVSKPEDYPYSSARNYAGEMGFLDVIVVEFSWITY